MSFLKYCEIIFLQRPGGFCAVFSSVIIALTIPFIFFKGKPTLKNIILCLIYAAVYFSIQTFVFSYLITLCYAAKPDLPFFLTGVPFLLMMILVTIIPFSKKEFYSRAMTSLYVFLSYSILRTICNEFGQIFSLRDENLLFAIPSYLLTATVIRLLTVRTFERENIPYFIVLILISLVIVPISDLLNDLFEKYRYESATPLFIICVGIYFILLAFFFIYYKISKEQEQNLQNLAISIRKNNDAKIVKLTNENIESLKKTRHELKNQYQYMQILLKEKNYQALEDFFSSMEEKASAPLHAVNCGNNAISGILSMEQEKANQNGIEIQYHILVPHQIKIKDFDLCSLMTNAIDNALESMEREGLKKEPLIIEIQFKNSYLLFNVSNPVIRIDPKRKTIKKDSFYHGYGRKIISDIVVSYDGIEHESVEDGRYIFYCALKEKTIYVK